MDKVISNMRALCRISEETEKRLRESVIRCDFPKRYRLIEEGGRLNVAYFVERGLTRSYWLVDGEEYTTSFSSEGSIVFSMDELYYGLASQEYVETMEPVAAYRISLDVLRAMFDENIEMANWGRIIHQNEYRRLHRSHRDRLTLPAPERYMEFMRQFPEVGRCANLGYIASYLGITLSTLSRIRRDNIDF
ncbi:MAG: Crp/Fnr family transcriptional regulator [Muribaculaceae bacterium]|nr:Crp/Fnr family transcriptional regulator [Muribaculaceae bacterium]